MKNTIAIIDFGSQYTQLIARRVRELQVYCEIYPWNATPQEVLSIEPSGFILSGGPSSVYENDAPELPSFIIESHIPILGICYGMQVLTRALGGRVASSQSREYGLAEINPLMPNPLIPEQSQTVWMSHGDKVEVVPSGFSILASSGNSPVAVMGDLEKMIFGVQFHPEVHHTPRGMEMLRNFVISICGVFPDWTPENIISDSITAIRRQVGDQTVLAAVSGGVDSSVATALVHRAVGSQLRAVFVDTGLLRSSEAEQVEVALAKNLGVQLTTLHAGDDFLQALKEEIDPENKRCIIGKLFIHLFDQAAKSEGNPPFLVQGTIYPDVVESSGPERSQARRIKSHHNVGGLPEVMPFKLVEPLRLLFKDEVRIIGETLGIPSELVWRQPFPGPGLAVRCLGKISSERIQKLRMADAIFIQELERAGLLNQKPGEGVQGLSQAFVVLLPVKSVGVMGDQRTYEETAVLRAVNTEDFMTADWAHLPHNLLAKVSNRIVNEVQGINRVVYDITSKPPATIEWE